METLKWQRGRGAVLVGEDSCLLRNQVCCGVAHRLSGEFFLVGVHVLELDLVLPEPIDSVQ